MSINIPPIQGDFGWHGWESERGSARLPVVVAKPRGYYFDGSARIALTIAARSASGTDAFGGIGTGPHTP